jgi:hypothetical protein
MADRVLSYDEEKDEIQIRTTSVETTVIPLHDEVDNGPGNNANGALRRYRLPGTDGYVLKTLGSVNGTVGIDGRCTSNTVQGQQWYRALEHVASLADTDVSIVRAEPVFSSKATGSPCALYMAMEPMDMNLETLLRSREFRRFDRLRVAEIVLTDVFTMYGVRDLTYLDLKPTNILLRHDKRRRMLRVAIGDVDAIFASNDVGQVATFPVPTADGQNNTGMVMADNWYVVLYTMTVLFLCCVVPLKYVYRTLAFQMLAADHSRFSDFNESNTRLGAFVDYIARDTLPDVFGAGSSAIDSILWVFDAAVNDIQHRMGARAHAVNILSAIHELNVNASTDPNTPRQYKWVVRHNGDNGIREQIDVGLATERAIREDRNRRRHDHNVARRAREAALNDDEKADVAVEGPSIDELFEMADAHARERDRLLAEPRPLEHMDITDVCSLHTPDAYVELLARYMHNHQTHRGVLLSRRFLCHTLGSTPYEGLDADQTDPYSTIEDEAILATGFGGGAGVTKDDLIDMTSSEVTRDFLTIDTNTDMYLDLSSIIAMKSAKSPFNRQLIRTITRHSTLAKAVYKTVRRYGLAVRQNRLPEEFTLGAVLYRHPANNNLQWTASGISLDIGLLNPNNPGEHNANVIRYTRLMAPEDIATHTIEDLLTDLVAGTGLPFGTVINFTNDDLLQITRHYVGVDLFSHDNDTIELDVDRDDLLWSTIKLNSPYPAPLYIHAVQ